MLTRCLLLPGKHLNKKQKQTQNAPVFNRTFGIFNIAGIIVGPHLSVWSLFFNLTNQKSWRWKNFKGLRWDLKKNTLLWKFLHIQRKPTGSVLAAFFVNHYDPGINRCIKHHQTKKHVGFCKWKLAFWRPLKWLDIKKGRLHFFLT